MNNGHWNAISMSNLVHDMLIEITEIYARQGIESAERLFDIMEDRLQLIYLYSTMLQDYVQEDNTIIENIDKLATQLG